MMPCSRSDRPDLISADYSILIECGTVNPDTVFAYFEYKIVERLICIPYPDEKDEIIAFIFEPIEATAEFLVFLREQKLQALKKNLLKQKKQRAPSEIKEKDTGVCSHPT